MGANGLAEGALMDMMLDGVEVTTKSWVHANMWYHMLFEARKGWWFDVVMSSDNHTFFARCSCTLVHSNGWCTRTGKVHD